jgi:hypothetical protein
MRKVFLSVILIFISHICSAPNIGFRFEMLKFQSLYGLINRRYHESEFSRFVNDLGSSESGNNWLINKPYWMFW